MPDEKASSPEDIFFSCIAPMLKVLYSSSTLKSALWNYLQEKGLASPSCNLAAALGRLAKEHGDNKQVGMVLDKIKADELQLYGTPKRKEEAQGYIDFALAGLDDDHTDLKRAIDELYPLNIRLWAGIVSDTPTVLARILPPGKRVELVLRYVFDANRWILHDEYREL